MTWACVECGAVGMPCPDHVCDAQGRSDPDAATGTRTAHGARRSPCSDSGLWQVPDDLLDDLTTDRAMRAALDRAHNRPNGARA